MMEFFRYPNSLGAKFFDHTPNVYYFFFIILISEEIYIYIFFHFDFERKFFFKGK